LSMAATIEQAPVKANAPGRPQPKDGGERHWRSVAKAISWRAVGTVDTMVISYLVTGKAKIAISIGFVELFTKVFLFYLHERAWHRIPYGRVAEKSE
jgi:uncharacterized membrane protein